jgi:hypothetical protein
MRRKAAIHIGMSALLSTWILPALILLVCSPLPTLSMQTADMYASAVIDGAISSRVEVELDIFSGNPNPIWILPEVDGVLFLKKLAMLPKASATELSDNLGYRGFIIKVINETGESVVRIQNGKVQFSQSGINIYNRDQNRNLERWLLNSGKTILRSDLYDMVERNFPENSTTFPACSSSYTSTKPCRPFLAHIASEVLGSYLPENLFAAFDLRTPSDSSR